MPFKKHKKVSSTKSATKSAWTNKAWEGRFSDATDPRIEQFTASFSYDHILYPYDIQGSLAHVEGLFRAGILTLSERTTLQRGLAEIEAEMSAEGSNSPSPLVSSNDEDIHMHIERRLIDKVGEVGGKLHTGRSRNDQVALDLRLYLRKKTNDIMTAIQQLQGQLVALAETHLTTVLPGYTHMQRAQPISLAHYLLAYYEMLERDRTRFQDGFKRMDQMPLGVGALAGNGFSIDRRAMAQQLGFRGVTENSLDTVSDRDFVVEFLSAASLTMTHFSRWAEEWVLWASTEFGFIDLPDRFCTGSSMMPQKKNPDMLELIRGKTGRVYGSLLAILVVLKGLPLTYNRDLQEDKESLFDGVKTLEETLAVMSLLLQQVRFNKSRMQQATEEGALLATDLADYLVLKGMPFRQAHHLIGKIVRHALDKEIPIERWTLAMFQHFSPLFEQGLFKRLSVASSIAHKKSVGGTSMSSIRIAIAKIKRRRGQ